MPEVGIEELQKRGIEAVNSGNTLSALILFEKAIQLENSPTNRSYLAFCIARERGQFKKAISLCEEAIREEPENSVHYLNLGRICLLSEQKTEAVRFFREGLNHGENKYIINELIKLGVRKPPLIPYLKRDNPLNKYLGILLSRLGFR
jgi:tetratricopeptide (TPR) repeat protein